MIEPYVFLSEQDVLQALQNESWPQARIVVTAVVDDFVEKRACELGAVVLPKPFAATDLTHLVRSLTS